MVLCRASQPSTAAAAAAAMPACLATRSAMSTSVSPHRHALLAWLSPNAVRSPSCFFSSAGALSAVRPRNTWSRPRRMWLGPTGAVSGTGSILRLGIAHIHGSQAHIVQQCTHTRMHAHTHAHTRARTHTHACMHPCTLDCQHTWTRTHARTHAHTHARTQDYTHARTHTRTPACTT